MQNAMEFPKSLTEKYRPERIEDFVGIARPKAMMLGFLKAPRPAAFLFVGASGTGKTTLALALAKQLPAEIHHIASRECDLERVQKVVDTCHYFPWSAKFHLVLVDEADQMTQAAQLAFLSKLDATAFPPNTIFIFTANSTRLLEPRFVSRNIRVEFGTEGINGDLTKYLARIWKRETGRKNGIDLKEIAAASEGNVRDALMRLDGEILAGGVPEEHYDEPETSDAPLTRYQEAARKAVATREANIRARVAQEAQA